MTVRRDADRGTAAVRVGARHGDDNPGSPHSDSLATLAPPLRLGTRLGVRLVQGVGCRMGCVLRGVALSGVCFEGEDIPCR